MTSSPTTKHTHFSRRLSPTRALVFLFLILIPATRAFVVSSTAQSARAGSDVESGERIYREGILPSGQPVRATVQGDIKLEGTQFNCASCHRRSGFGSSEGAAYVPPISWRALSHERELRRADLFRKLYQEAQPTRFRARVRDPRVRPAYTDETLAAALREGKDPSGRELDPLMPRYELSDGDVRDLVAYLKTLSAAPAPGVDKSRIHFATVVTQGVSPEERRAMLDVMDAYFRWKNADTARMLQRPGVSPLYKEDFYGAYREWVLHVWELKGPPATWPGQLQRYYREQPVFALLSGIGAGSWQPVHDFCEREAVPCLFPHTDLPVVSPTGDYSLYFSKGLIVEAEALAQRLRDETGAARATRIVQVYRDAVTGLAPARALRHALRGDGATRLRDRVIENNRELTPAFWKSLIKEERPSVLVLWLGQSDFSYERIQINTYFALYVAEHSLTRLVENFSREYFIESVEHEMEGSPNPGIFPHLSLGPGQRFASKGSYIVRLPGETKAERETAGDWIIP
ncbi:MAG: cytochrome c [Acidobacteria bacterium]|nr:cytochrome c [Acidobacteriota bacterium]